jgi:hypothetical protein
MKKVLDDEPGIWAGMVVGRLEAPANMDFTPLLEGLPNDMCHCPHWGYIFSGALHIRYADGSEEVLEEGEAYYMPPGHTVWTTDRGVDMLVVGPEKEEREVMEHTERRQQELGLEIG